MPEEKEARPVQELEDLELRDEVSREDHTHKRLTRQLIRKLDTRCVVFARVPCAACGQLSNRASRILPLLILLVLCSFLDRTNVGNAKLYSLEADLGMANAQYNQGLAAFYPLYIAS